MAGIVGPIVALVVKKIVKHEDKRSEKESNSSLLPEYREAYHKDLRDLFQLIEDNIPKTYTKTHFDSLMLLPFEQKRLILQHFFTDEKRFHSHYELYSSYRKYVGHINAIIHDKKKLFHDINDFSKILTKFNDKYKKSKTKFEREKLEAALNFPEFTLGSDIGYYSNQHFYQKIPYNLEIAIEQSDKNKIFFVINKVRIGETESLDDFYKICDKLRDRIRMISDSSREIETDYKVVDDWFSRYYSNFLIIALEPMKRGNSIIGACEGCIEYFGHNEKHKLQKLLKKFNSNWSNSIETSWRIKKPLRKSFSQIFTKNHSNSFRDGLE
jgi:hypothetical protein